MRPNVFWYNECRGSWCHAIVEWLTAECQHINGYDLMELNRRGIVDGPAVVVFKADHIKDNAGDYISLNAYLAHFDSVLVIVTANEEGSFRPDGVRHKRMRMWIQTPTYAQQQWCSAAIPWGWTPGFDGTCWQSRLPGYDSREADRMVDYSFVGQDTHDRRHACIRALETKCSEWPNCVLTSHGFSRGLPRHLYFELLVNSKIVVCPSGPRTVDTFRVWEALEAGAIPIVDGRSTRDNGRDYWDFVAGPDHPLSVIEEWDGEIEWTLRQTIENWPKLQLLFLNWWTARKVFWQRKFRTDLEMLQTL